MTPRIRTLTTALWAVAILGMCALLASWTTSHILAGRSAATTAPAAAAVVLKSEPAPLPDIPAPSFSLVDQDNVPFSSDDLNGKVWIADFFFTTCTGPCPRLTQQMSLLNKKLTDPRIQFVSFSIDPETDTPPVLKAYAAKFHPSANWHFLTGPDNAAFSLARAFKLPALPATGDNPIFHTTKIILVSPAGKVAGYYDYNDPAAMTKLATDAQTLANSLPK
jgi:protein SCO1/2